MQPTLRISRCAIPASNRRNPSRGTGYSCLLRSSGKSSATRSAPRRVAPQLSVVFCPIATGKTHSARVGAAVGAVEQVDGVGDLDRAAALPDLAGDLENAADVARDDRVGSGSRDLVHL